MKKQHFPSQHLTSETSQIRNLDIQRESQGHELQRRRLHVRIEN